NVRNDFPGMGSSVQFEKQTVDLSAYYNATDPGSGTPMRLEARQHTDESGSGWYTLFTDFDAGPVFPLPILKGDVNGDSKVDVSDAVLTLKMVVGGIPVTPLLLQAGDVAPKNDDGSVGDGQILINDAVRTLRRA